MTDAVSLQLDPFPDENQFASLWLAAWGTSWDGDLRGVLRRSLAHLGAYDGPLLVGYVNVAWDGGIHAFLLDTTVHPDYRRQGLGRNLVLAARDAAASRGARWLHVDFEARLADFYTACGFKPTAAGLIELPIR